MPRRFCWTQECHVHFLIQSVTTTPWKCVRSVSSCGRGASSSGALTDYKQSVRSKNFSYNLTLPWCSCAVDCKSLASHNDNLETFKCHLDAVKRLRKLLSAQSDSVSAIAQDSKFGDKKSPQLEFQKLQDMAEGWLQEFREMRFELELLQQELAIG